MINKIKVRMGTETLVQLTNHNEDRDATTINDARLQAAIDDSIGAFVGKTGIAFNSDDTGHVTILVSGVLYHLQFYKDLDSALTDKLARDFFGALKALRLRKSLLFTTDSQRTYTEETTRVPFDPSRNIFNARRH